MSVLRYILEVLHTHWQANAFACQWCVRPQIYTSAEPTSRHIEADEAFWSRKMQTAWAGPLVLWLFGPLVLWSRKMQTVWANPLVLWSFDPLVLWSFGPGRCKQCGLVLWSFGPLVLWSFGSLVLWSFGPGRCKQRGPRKVRTKGTSVKMGKGRTVLE